MLRFRLEFIVLPPERDNLRIGMGAPQSGHPVAEQSATIDDLFCGKVTGPGLQGDTIRMMFDADDLRTSLDQMSLFLNSLTQPDRHLPVIDNACFGNMNPTDACHVRFVFFEPGRPS